MRTLSKIVMLTALIIGTATPSAYARDYRDYHGRHDRHSYSRISWQPFAYRPPVRHIVYYERPVYVTPSPQIVYVPAPQNIAYTTNTNTSQSYCREYQSLTTVGGRTSQTYGTACMQPDGSWQITN